MATLDEATVPDTAGLVGTANDLIPLLRRNAEQSERDRRLTSETEDVLRSAGLFQALTPRRAGGAGGNVRTLVELTAEISRGDSSAGWVAFIANTTAFAMGLFNDDVRAAVYDDPRNVAVSQFGPSGTATVVDGGYRITGRSGFSSGCYQAQWNMSGFLVPDEDGKPKELGYALMPTSALTIDDTWNMAGMAGTGSNTFVSDDVFVSSEFTVDFDTFQGYKLFEPWHEDETIYRAPLGPVACLGINGPLMGMAEAAYDFALETMTSGKPVNYWKFEDRRLAPSYRFSLADARMTIDTGRFHLLRAADDLDRIASEGRLPDVSEKARVRGDSSIAARSFRDAVTLLLDISGTSSFALSNPLQRIWRDITVATSHGLNNILLNRELYALDLVGLDAQEIGLI
ncbi:oxidoreductase [Streptomyces sp. NPDC005799]|uniref:oxidoreductase n=1 Tax=Streptomyces sp. NPDC005799 TaxID=3154678 RepID=UPI00340813D7